MRSQFANHTAYRCVHVGQKSVALPIDETLNRRFLPGQNAMQLHMSQIHGQSHVALESSRKQQQREYARQGAKNLDRAQVTDAERSKRDIECDDSIVAREQRQDFFEMGIHGADRGHAPGEDGGERSRTTGSLGRSEAEARPRQQRSLPQQNNTTQQMHGG